MFNGSPAYNGPSLPEISMLDVLTDLIQGQDGYVELRYHEHRGNGFMAQKGRFDHSGSSIHRGVGIRVLENGCWGFSSTSDVSPGAIALGIEEARASARSLVKYRMNKVEGLAEANLSTISLEDPAYSRLMELSLEEKIGRVIELERALEKEHSKIHTALVSYSEIFEEKVIVTTDGAACSRKLVRPEIRTMAYLGEGADQVLAGRAVGVTGDWEALFGHHEAQNMVEETAREGLNLLTADHAPAGLKDVVLAPSLVGLLCHEAIGHTVEADFVEAGSVAKGKLGVRVGSELVSLHDGGQPALGEHPAGYLPFDDEGVSCSSTTIIEDGVLTSYLHDRESAYRHGQAPMGNARAWSYNDEPLIRMTNTWLEPGDMELEGLLEGVEDGLLVLGAGGGQADANGEFMFGSSCAREIRSGKLGKWYREASLSGVAFDVLQSIDGLSKDFRWDLGSGYCGKGQSAKVDAGGPFARCKMMVGGRL